MCIRDSPIGIQRDGRDALETDPTGVLGQYRRAMEAREEGEWVLENLGMTLEEVNEAWDRGDSDDIDVFTMMSLEEYRDACQFLAEVKYLEWTDDEEYGWPSYKIVYRESGLVAQGWNADNLDEIVKGMAREYSAWACGSVYLMGIESPSGEPEYLGLHAGFDPWNESEVKDVAAGYVENVELLESLKQM